MRRLWGVSRMQTRSSGPRVCASDLERDVGDNIVLVMGVSDPAIYSFKASVGRKVLTGCSKDDGWSVVVDNPTTVPRGA